MSAVSRAEPTTPPATAPRSWPVLVVVVCAQMLIWLDTSILNVAVTTLADPADGLGATPAAAGLRARKAGGESGGNREDGETK
jgi:hypothetical protein